MTVDKSIKNTHRHVKTQDDPDYWVRFALLGRNTHCIWTQEYLRRVAREKARR